MVYKEVPAEISFHLGRCYRGFLDMLQARQAIDCSKVDVRLSHIYDLTRMLEMAIKKGKQEAPKKAEFRGFFNYSLNDEQKADCKTWIRKEEEVAIGIQDSIASGYKVSVGLDSKGVGYQASMQCNNVKDANAGLCLSAYANNWYDALAVLMFKHIVILEKTWEENEQPQDLEDFG